MNVQWFTNSSKAFVTTVRSGKLGVLLREFKRRFHSRWTHYGLCRDLHQPFEPTAAKIPITVRPLQQSDVPYLLSMNAPGISERGPYVRMHRLNFLQACIGTCYVAVTEDGRPCYMQWLMGSSPNREIQDYFRGIFPVLAPDEALLEYAFTPEGFQGKGIMSYAMARIAERAADIGATRVITFVDHRNFPALKGCKRAGFRPYITRTDQWQFFRRRVEFAPLPPGSLHTPSPQHQIGRIIGNTGSYIGTTHLENAMSKSIVIAAASTADLTAAPVTPDWVINGVPKTRSRKLARSRDRTSYVIVWDCTAGRFNWHYDKDETLVVLSGEAFITNEKGEERRIGAGDVVFFPAGTSSKWHVPEYIKKVAVLRHTMPRPIGFGVLVWNLLLRIVWRGSGSPLILTLLFDPLPL